MSEGGTTDSFTVKLRSAPTDNVTISVTTSNEEGDASPRSLTFTTSDYNAPKPVNVSGNDDYIIDGTQDFYVVLGSASSQDPFYSGLTPDPDLGSN